MNPYQKMVREFHIAMGHPNPDERVLSAGTHPMGMDELRRLSRRLDLRRKLILEEANEFNEAASEEVMIDALCDLLYVTFGTAVELGIDLDPFFIAVHEANMKKLEGPTREDGKRLKPEGWEPPPIQKMLDAGVGDAGPQSVRVINGVELETLEWVVARVVKRLAAEHAEHRAEIERLRAQVQGTATTEERWTQADRAREAQAALERLVVLSGVFGVVDQRKVLEHMEEQQEALEVIADAFGLVLPWTERGQ